jgi:hypothetical protein
VHRLRRSLRRKPVLSKEDHLASRREIPPSIPDPNPVFHAADRPWHWRGDDVNEQPWLKKWTDWMIRRSPDATSADYERGRCSRSAMPEPTIERQGRRPASSNGSPRLCPLVFPVAGCIPRLITLSVGSRAIMSGYPYHFHWVQSIGSSPKIHADALRRPGSEEQVLRLRPNAHSRTPRASSTAFSDPRAR